MSYLILRFWLKQGACLTSFLLIIVACQQAPAPNNFDADEVKREVEKAVWTFHAADTSRNAKAVIDLLWPEYSMLADGNRIQYGDVANGSPQFMAGLNVFHTEWTELEIIPISATAALSSFLFRDSLVRVDGEIIKKQGPTTMLWEKRSGEWRLRYGDADHYPW